MICRIKLSDSPVLLVKGAFADAAAPQPVPLRARRIFRACGDGANLIPGYTYRTSACMTRSYQPIPDAEWPLEIADLKDSFAGRLNVYRVMAHHPELLRAWVPLRRHLVQSSTLGPEQLEVAILRTAHRLNAPYEWAHHVERGRAAGLSDARIQSMRGTA